jgi:hypothetical protein
MTVCPWQGLTGESMTKFSVWAWINAEEIQSKCLSWYKDYRWHNWHPSHPATPCPTECGYNFRVLLKELSVSWVEWELLFPFGNISSTLKPALNSWESRWETTVWSKGSVCIMSIRVGSWNLGKPWEQYTMKTECTLWRRKKHTGLVYK